MHNLTFNTVHGFSYLYSIQLGKDVIYHPGGIDFDGKYIWVPVCEYRPFGKSMIYRVNPETMKATLVTTIPDAIGAVAYNKDNNELGQQGIL
ncbi:MAG: DUF6454 family protein [Agriterribacter sp.]